MLKNRITQKMLGISATASIITMLFCYFFLILFAKSMLIATMGKTIIAGVAVFFVVLVGTSLV